MTHITPVISASEKNKVKKNDPGPRAETLMIISQFARIYEYEPEQEQKVRNSLLN